MACSEDKMNKDIGKRISDLRKKHVKKDGKKLTQEEFASELGLSRTIIAKIESGVQPVTPKQISDISKFFGVTTDFIITGVSAKNVTVADELCLSNDTIEALLLRSKNKKENVPYDKWDDSVLNDAQMKVIELLINDQNGRDLVDFLYSFFWIDFNEGVYIDPPDKVNAIKAQNLYFKHGFGDNEWSSLPAETMRYALIHLINSTMERIKKNILGRDPWL